MKHLVIVESPTKARTIGKFLGKDYEIKASMGHVMDLPKNVLGVNVEHNFEPEYKVIGDKKKIISELKSAAKSADSIILATDPDREGEAIASHVAEILKGTTGIKSTTSIKGKKIKTPLDTFDTLDARDTPRVSRIVFHEITKEAIEGALKNPRSIDAHLVDAQTARRVLDRLVGYKLSPLLWQKVRRGLSAGRVQSVALRLIVEREREIEKFKKEEYWTVHAELIGIKNQESRIKSGTEFDLIEINGNKIEVQRTFQLYNGEYRTTKTLIDNEKKAQEIEEDLKTKHFTVSDVVKKETKRTPQPPFTTSTLQQEAARRFGFVGKRTMSLAQKLYEEGFITYHRTDSVTISMSALQSIRSFIKKEYGDKYLPEKTRLYTTKQKLAQEAHEAIRPTAVDQISNIIHSTSLGQEYQISNSVGNDGWRLYELIWKRAVASQMSDAVIESTTIYVDSQIQNSKFKIQNEGNFYRFKANGSVLVFDGFLKANIQALQDKNLPEFNALEYLDLLKALADKHETQPPPRYNEASLIKALEEEGIGRPSTYAAIISTIEGRQYIERTEGKFIPTSVGVAVNDFLVTNFSNIDDIAFTAQMEDELDRIAQGKKEWSPMIKEFYSPFAKKLEEVKDAKRVQIEVEKTDDICEKCGSPMVIRIGRFGKFLSCSKFPECKFSKPFVLETKLTCPKDGGKIIVKKTKRGRIFYGCSNYPKCDYASWNLKDLQHV